MHLPTKHSVNEDNTDNNGVLGMSFTVNAHDQVSITEEQSHCTFVLSQREIQEFIIGAV